MNLDYRSMKCISFTKRIEKKLYAIRFYITVDGDLDYTVFYSNGQRVKDSAVALSIIAR